MRKFLLLITVLVLFSIWALAQNRVVTGKVTDERGEPIPGATIRIRNARTGTSADMNGMFSISVPPNATLLISGIGSETKEVSVGQETTINVSLTTSVNTELSAVTVTALGIRRQPKQLGYSTTKITTAELTQAKVTNIASGLAAKVSGLQINTVNNGINPSTRITLRGNRSILGNNQALLVLDDVPLPISYINSINPNDVENVTVLKGASASALYGSSASNGVIIITTKKGTKGEPQIRYSNTTTLEEISYLPKFQNEFGGFGGEALNAPGTTVFPEFPFLPYVPYENQSFGPRFNGQMVAIGGPVRIFREDGTFYDSTLMDTYAAKPKAKKAFFDIGVTVQNDLSYSTGDDNSKFFLSLQDVNTTGIVPKDKNRRSSIRLSGTRENGKFKADYSVGYSIRRTNTAQGSYFQDRPVYWTVINTPPHIDLRRYRDWKNDPFANPNGYFNAYYGNPWWQIDESRLDDRSSDLLANLALTVQPWEWLSITARGGLLRSDNNSKYTKAGFTFADWAKADPLHAGNIPSSVQKLDPQSSDAFRLFNRFTGDFFASFDKDVKDFSFNVIGGVQVIDNLNRNLNVVASSLVIPDFYNISNRIGEPGVSENKFQTRTIGVFGDATIGFKDFLFIHGSARNDWVSTLSKDNRSFLYPAVDASFIFTDAISALQENKILNFGKIRAAYSKTAQVSIGPYSLENTFNAGGGFPFGNVAGFTLNNNFSNPDIKPEFTREMEIGLELGLLNNRIYFSAAYFDALTNNQTIPITVSSTTGYTSATINSGEMSNKGIELDLKFTPLLETRSGFRWDVGINFSHINNKVISIASGLDEVNVGGNSFAVVGKSYPQLKVSDWQRDSVSNKIIVNASNGFPTPDPTPKTFGGTNPPLRIGVNTNISFKGLTLTAVADYRSGGYIYNAIGGDLDFTGVSWNSARYGRQRFVIPNSVYLDGSKYVDNTTITTRDGNNEFWASTWNQVGSPYVTSADFWKLREVSLSYAFPARWFNKVKIIKSMNFGVVGRNLLMWRPKENIWTDPEFSNTIENGIGTTNIFQTPPTRIYGANLTVVF